jgi:hypothetical protein
MSIHPGGLAMMGIRIVVMLATLLWAVPAGAACLRDNKGQIVCGAGMCVNDRRGDVYCAALRLGSAFRTRDGWVICGRGGCTSNRQGEYLCSDVEGGAVMRDTTGAVRCEGNCEYASYDLCERRPAGY